LGLSSTSWYSFPFSAHSALSRRAWSTTSALWLPP